MAITSRDNTLQSGDTDGASQFNRQYKLVVFASTSSNADLLNGIDLSPLRIKFAVKRTSSMTPNIADIRVYNLDEQTIAQIGARKEFNRVVLEAGYEGSYGTIFEGNIKQLISGRESATDTFIDIVAGDGDHAYNYAVVNSTIKAGSNLQERINTALTPMQNYGVKPGYLGDFSFNQLPRGKTMWGDSKHYLREASATSGKDWSIQDGNVMMVGKNEYLKGVRVVLTSKTGMIGTPQQTNEGVNIKCLLNPIIRVNTAVEINNASVARLKVDLSNPKSQVNTAAPITADGVYYVLAIEYQGDTRGVEWYCNLICLNLDVSSNPINAVSNGG